MRLSRDKVNKLAHTIADSLAEVENVDFIEDRNTIRMECRKILEELFANQAFHDAVVDDLVEVVSLQPRTDLRVGLMVDNPLHRGSEHIWNPLVRF